MRTEIAPGFTGLWAAYAASTYGTWLSFGAFPLIAVQVLHAPTLAVSLLEAVGLAVGALVAVGVGPFVERRRKPSVMIAADLVRCAAVAGIPLAYLAGVLKYAQLLVVSMVSAAAGIAFSAASGAYLKRLVPPERLLAANGRFEATMWSATAIGPPIGGALIGLVGPVVTVAADAASFVVSAILLRGMLPQARNGSSHSGVDDVAAPRPAPSSDRIRMRDLLVGWQTIAAEPVLRRLFANAVTVNGLIMATSPLLAVLLLGEYRFAAWEYGLAFGVPCIAGFVGARCSPPLVERFGRTRMLLVFGWLRSLFPIGLVFVQPGLVGLLVVIVVEALLICCMGVFNPISATERLQRISPEVTARVLTAWNVSSTLAQAISIAAWGVLATFTGTLPAIVISSVLLLVTPVLLPGRRDMTGSAEASSGVMNRSLKIPRSGE